MQKSKLNANPVGATSSRPHFEGMTQNKGITLIALIITIIVMLILVGVAINIALNGGLFGKAEKATYQTEASTVKEQLELAKVLKRIENGGSAVPDYSGIKVGELADLDEKTKGKYAEKIVVNKAGDICYNPEKVTDTEERTWLEEIGIREYVNMVEPEKFTFKLGDIAPNATFADSWIQIPANNFWTGTVSDELKNSATTVTAYGQEMAVYESVTCSDLTFPNACEFFESDPMGWERGFVIMSVGDEIWLHIRISKVNSENVDENNWSTYQDLEFTITL